MESAWLIRDVASCGDGNTTYIKDMLCQECRDWLLSKSVEGSDEGAIVLDGAARLSDCREAWAGRLGRKCSRRR